MTETITLFNTGQRRIEYRKGAFFKPGTSVAFPILEANKLRRLYKNEIKILEDFSADYIPENTNEKSTDIKTSTIKKENISKVEKVSSKRGRPAKESKIEFEKGTEGEKTQE